ncbi:hypothetical protein [Ohtaekwangia koreensis]|uniref:Por secretion system C-terminal sorting domain-containing protein n=1 Tax=Ohtaekwangia koreensis TaxID=688867 RepID=A0A1T5IS72_9BACT|nr:hypothetical protein [Ohtaekwangia koreensis]SKC41828.1 hypothetical protein SAMN05660236_0324 [Ohtaekwangia koreensis]
MKKSLSIVAALMIFSSTLFAGIIDNPNAATGMAIMKNGSTIKLFYKGTKQADVKVSIYNATNSLVYSETIKNVDGFVRPYNFSNLAEGEYSIELIGDNGRQIERVSYKLGKVEKLANVLHVAGERNKYILTVANKGQDVLTVKIYGDKGTLLYSKVENVDGDFAQVYNFEQYAGSITFEVSDSKGVTKSLSL